ncbi:hypothetical protein PENSTE_c007G01748 [Penicillium steckii]|uniref:Zn(2)-C6 fungal-type domain-containing protein n=1 Tax=Penicillium steckii TaxID=303698 RepID=A0A1V6TED8_9EURO|nr:hypothetical protein PENSTE_c007G01748 [Penicillium steckii]
MTDLRLRRAHAKSRGGCLRCKQQRKKCDESKPSCSRCAKKRYSCQYQDLRDSALSSDDHMSVECSASRSLPRPSSSYIASSEEPLVLSSEHLSIHGSSPHESSPNSITSHSQGFSKSEGSISFGSESSTSLNATELGLLSHYLTHTSRTIPFDELDLYALSVGIPNLAFNSKPVMSSLIALAAACKSHNIVHTTQTPLAESTILEIQQLLEIAEHHHRASLQHIRRAVTNSDWYDSVLANAALMVLYASASHSIRVHLASIARRSGIELPHDVLPQHSQWITFTRAAHTASTAVLSGLLNMGTNLNPPSSLTSYESMKTMPSVLQPQSGPSESTKRHFMPLVTSTYSRAFQSLRKKIETVADCFKDQKIFGLHYNDVEACLKTLPILEECASMALSGRNTSDQPDLSTAQLFLPSEDSRVSSWVGNYMLSVTSMTAPKALRRIIMSFLNKAPAEYLNLVQEVLDSSSVQTYTGDLISRGSPTGEMQPLDATHLLAIEIFAHWLVLVMLLDGVWWIGGIGRWELGQIVSLMKTQQPFYVSPDSKETWWPESMYMINMELMPDV